jgi:flagellar biosynthesis/type III secretory pathway protein FliH|tara:strand:+ start:386 stop:706 length:321 start_codon:yes stop_codon:yes gene_type:complete
MPKESKTASARKKISRDEILEQVISEAQKDSLKKAFNNAILDGANDVAIGKGYKLGTKLANDMIKELQKDSKFMKKIQDTFKAALEKELANRARKMKNSIYMSIDM